MFASPSSQLNFKVIFNNFFREKKKKRWEKMIFKSSCIKFFFIKKKKKSLRRIFLQNVTLPIAANFRSYELLHI